MSYRRVSSNPSLLSRASSTPGGLIANATPTSSTTTASSSAAVGAGGAGGGAATPSNSSRHPVKKTAKDFVFAKLIGEGSFSNVFLGIDVLTGREYAIKVCEKRQILREKKQHYICQERLISQMMSNIPGFLDLGCSFHDHRYFYFVMTLAKNGNLLQLLQKEKTLKLETARHYAAEILLSCEQMHRLNIIHRDLKPENILLNDKMHTLIADFGSAKILTKDDLWLLEEKTKVNINETIQENELKADYTSSSSTQSLNAPKSPKPPSIPTGSSSSASASSISSPTRSQSNANKSQSAASTLTAASSNLSSRTTLKVPSTDSMTKSNSFNGSPSEPVAGSDDLNINASISSNKSDEEVLEASTATTPGSRSDNPSRVSRNRRQVTGSFVGTAQYVSPEVLQSELVSPMADLWALGCILYQMISGKTPFRGDKMNSIFKEIKACNVVFPADFDPHAADLIRKLLKTKPKDRLGSEDVFGYYTSIQSHPFFASINFQKLRDQPVPGIPASYTSETILKTPENWRQLETGLDDTQLNRLCGLDFLMSSNQTASSNSLQPTATPASNKSEICYYYSLSAEEKNKLFEEQKTQVWHKFVDNEFILKKGFINKRKGLFPRKRMFLLTTGPRLIYIDPVPMIKKGEIPWSSELKVEARTFKSFWIHTPNRIYYLEDTSGFALQWVKAIEELYDITYKEQGNKENKKSNEA